MYIFMAYHILLVMPSPDEKLFQCGCYIVGKYITIYNSYKVKNWTILTNIVIKKSIKLNIVCFENRFHPQKSQSNEMHYVNK